MPGTRTTVWPPPSTRQEPEWADQLEDEALGRVLDEVYVGLNQGLVVLATIGTRTLLDRAMFLKEGEQPNGFPGKLDAMVAKGRMGADEKDTFPVITDVGGAAVHRGFAPDSGTLNTVLSAAEALLYREFAMPKDSEAVRKATPRRPKS